MKAESDLFPKTSNYERELVRKYSVGGNVLYSTEALAKSMKISPGMKVLDLGCGKALSSVFLAKEYQVHVWAVDKFFSARRNFELVQLFHCEENVHPLDLDARMLPFPDNYFDCIISVNAFTYFGTDDKYLPYISRFLKPGGQIGITDICFAQEIETVNEIPDFLRETFYDYWYHIHSLNWWENKWLKTGLLESVAPSLLGESDSMKDEYINYSRQDNADAFAACMQKDLSNFILYFSLVGTRGSKAAFLEESFFGR